LQGNVPLSQINGLAITYLTKKGVPINKNIIKDIENLFADEGKSKGLAYRDLLRKPEITKSHIFRL